MMQALVHATNVSGARRKAIGSTLLRSPGSNSPVPVILERRVPIGMPRGVSQTLDICREAPLLWAWRREA